MTEAVARDVRRRRLGGALGRDAHRRSPATGEAIGEIPQGDREDAQRAIAAASRAADGLGEGDRVRARRRVAPRRRRDRAAARRARAHADARPGQAAAREAYDEVEELDRLLAQRRRGREAARRPAAELGLARQARAAHSPPARRGRRDHPVELAVHHAGRADRARARVREHGRLDSGAETSIAAVALAECIAEADLPPGVFNLVTGPGRSSATRSRATRGRRRSASSARRRRVGRSPRLPPARPAILELGGNGPVVVLDDADLDAAAEAAVTACFLCAGQSCTAGERLLVHRDVREEFVEKLAALVCDRAVLGDPFADETTSGR